VQKIKQLSSETQFTSENKTRTSTRNQVHSYSTTDEFKIQ